MKRIGYLYEKICSLENIQLAIVNASKGKKKRETVRHVVDNLEFYANKLHELLVNKTLRLGRNRVKTIWDTSSLKFREITVPRFFPDQVTQWALIQVLRPLMERGMYRYCCGSVPKRGGQLALDETVKAVRDKETRYVAKMDILKFFPSIKVDVLYGMFERRIKDKDCLWLIEQILDSAENLPIGYYTSQWWSNFYLQGIDHYIKENLRVKYYVRYVDDIVLVDKSKYLLHFAIGAINYELGKIGLELKDNWQVWKKDSRPIDFVGYRIWSYKVEVRKRIEHGIERRTHKIAHRGNCTKKQAQGLLSLLGYLTHCNGRRLYTDSVKPIISLRRLKYVSKGVTNGNTTC